MQTNLFNYDKAFSRNLGWVTEEEQQQLKQKKIAIAGAGGVGSIHLLTLVRQGIGRFNIADFDQFDVHNFNRQAGAFMSTIGRDKAEVMHEMALDINPELDISVFSKGIDTTNVDAFLEGVDVYVDSLDFFAIEARILVFQKCQEKRIPVVTAAPLGMGCAFLCFLPGKMTFEQYFRFNGKSREEQLIMFLVGLSPAMLQRQYLVDPSRVSFKEQRGPSTCLSVHLCSGIAAANVLKIVLRRGEVITAPYGLHFDAYRNKLVKTWRPFGNAGIVPRIMAAIARKIVAK